MSTRVGLTHHMSYRFDRSVGLSPHVVRLRPAPHCRTPILAYSLTVTPSEHFINWQQDPFGNHLARLVFPEPARELTVTVDLVADLAIVNPFDFFVEESAERYPFTYDATLRGELAPFLPDDEPSPLLAKWLRDWSTDPASSASGGPPIADYLVELNQRVFRSVAYTTRMEPGVQTPDETLEKKLGSCRDSAWLLVHILRRVGLAARFVSGYLVQLRPDEAPLDRPAGTTQRLHGSPRLGRDLYPRGRLDRSRSHLRSTGRGRPSPPRMHAASVDRGADLGDHRSVRRHVRVFQHAPSARSAAPRHPALFRGAVEGHRRPRR